MPSFKIINNFSEIDAFADWTDSEKFNSKFLLYQKNGKPICSNYKGKQYQIIAKKEQFYYQTERFGRAILGILSTIFTLGISLCSKKVRRLFSGNSKIIRLAIKAPSSSNNPKLSTLSINTINRMFPLVENPIEHEAKFSFYTSEDIQEALKANLLQPHHLQLITDHQLKGLKLAELDREIINQLFPGFVESKKLIKQKEIFKHFSSGDVKKALEARLLQVHHLQLITDDQFKGIKLAQLDKVTINKIFPEMDSVINLSKQKNRFQFFSSEDIEESLEADLLDIHLYRLVSIDQFKCFNLSNVSKKVINFILPFHSGFIIESSFFKLWLRESLISLRESEIIKMNALDPSTKSILTYRLNEYFDIASKRVVHKESYKVLGLDLTASISDVRKKSSKLLLKYHPDKNHRHENESDDDFKLRIEGLTAKYQAVIEAKKAILGT
ncbi:MAG: DnaJ domain-containing protein [Chlamydiota bacterium]|nr:DnaJ domain-containing protein [Chlamydiota bacterium]